MSLKDLIQQRADLVGSNRALLDRADAEKRQLNSEEQAEYDKRDKEIDSLTDKVNAVTAHETRRQRMAALETELARPTPRQVPPSEPGSGPPRGERAPEALTVQVGRHPVTFAPNSDGAALASPQYRQAFASYLAGGRADQLGLVAGKDPQGGYLAPLTFVNQLVKFLDDLVFMRRLATVLPPMTSGVNLGVVSLETDPGDADWTAEVPAADISEDTSTAFGKREFSPNLLTKLIKMSMKILRASSVLDVESFVAQRLAYKFAITEEKAFLTGDGNKKPLGVFTAHADGIPAARDTACASQTAFTADELVDCFYSLKAAYRARATWLTHREFVKRVRKLKSGDSQWLWSPGIQAGQPDMILSRPYVESEYVPSTYTTGLYVAAVGDFSHYWIADSLQLEVQRLGELFALRNQVGLLGRKETDGQPTMGEAFARLKLA